MLNGSGRVIKVIQPTIVHVLLFCLETFYNGVKYECHWVTHTHNSLCRIQMEGNRMCWIIRNMVPAGPMTNSCRLLYLYDVWLRFYYVIQWGHYSVNNYRLIARPLRPGSMLASDWLADVTWPHHPTFTTVKHNVDGRKNCLPCWLQYRKIIPIPPILNVQTYNLHQRLPQNLWIHVVLC